MCQYQRGHLVKYIIMEQLSKCKMPFAIRLVEALKSRNFITSGIMLPLLVGAYKIKDNREEPVDYNYLKNVFSNLIEELYETKRHMYIKECEASHNFVLEVSERPLGSYKLHICCNGTPVIYCKDSNTECMNIDLEEAVNYLIDKYISVLGKYCNYNDMSEYPHMHAIDIKEFTRHRNDAISERDVIIDILKNSAYGY